MYEFLEDFPERMKLIGAADSIINRKHSDSAIKEMFSDSEFICLVTAVLVGIMEKALSEKGGCDMDYIEEYLGEILPAGFGLTLSRAQVAHIAHFIIQSVLQNEGRPQYFETVTFTDMPRKNLSINLIEEKEEDDGKRFLITYSLSKMGYDFLFHTKEVDKELQMTLEELRLKELIKRKNFTEANRQSRNLIQSAMQKRNEIQALIARIKRNVNDVSVEEYSDLIRSVYDQLTEEYELLEDILTMAKKSAERIRHEYDQKLQMDESIQKAQKDIGEIERNIGKTLSIQKDLLDARHDLKNLYKDTLSEALIYSSIRRFDIGEAILEPMEKNPERIGSFWQLLNPLFGPAVRKRINLETLYSPQSILAEEEDAGIAVEVEELLLDDTEPERIADLNCRYTEILDALLSTAIEQGGECRLSDVLEELAKDREQYDRLTDGKLLFLTILLLYNIERVDVSRWRETDTGAPPNLTEEFDLEYSMGQLLPDRDYMRDLAWFEVEKDSEETCEMEIGRRDEDGMALVQKIEITDFKIKTGVTEDDQHEDSTADM